MEKEKTKKRNEKMKNKKKKFKMKKQTIAIIVLAVLLALVLSYLGVEKYQENKQQGEMEIYQKGAMFGYEQAVLQVMDAATSCEAVPLRNGNFTMDVVDVECLSAR